MSATEPANPVVVSAERLRSLVQAALEAHGATGPDAEIQAETLVAAELRGHPSHGVRRLRVLVGRLRAGLIRSGAEPREVWRTESVLAVDGRYGFGPVVARRAVDAIAERATRTGIALATVAGSHHVGILAPYVERLVERGCAGIAMTISEALVHPWGGASSMVGTNPIGIGVPTAHEPLILDMSTSAVSAGKILDHAARDEPIPEGWAVDADGVPTTDPHAAARGALSPFGGAKGYALGIALEALVGALTGSALGQDVHGTLDVDAPVNKGDVFIAIHLDAAGGRENLAGLAAYLDDVRASGTGGRTVGIPGDRSRALTTERRATGIPVDAGLYDEIRHLAGEGNAA